MDISSRKQAVDAGKRYFFTGKPCKHGHISERYVGNGACVECLRPKSIAVISSPGEIMPPRNTELTINQRSRLEIERQKIEIRSQRQMIELKKFELQLEGRRERQMKEQRKATVKSQLIDTFVFIDPLDYARVTTSIWGFAIMRDPMLKKEDVIPGREMKDCRFVVKCFPEDQAEILKFTGAIWAARNAKVIEDKKQSVAQELTALAESSVDWPEGDPK